MKCLLVDDEPGIRQGMALLLRRRGHEVCTAADCASAEQALEHDDYDVVVTDWRLPDGLAESFLAACRAPVVAVSGHPDEVAAGPDASEPSRSMIRAVLAKPVRPATLLDCIDELLAPASEHATPAAHTPPPQLEMVLDVRRVVDDVLAQLPPDVCVDLRDDGTFVVLRARLPDGYVPSVRNLGGDLRLVQGVGERVLELRLCRDGRPALDVPVVPIDDDWPECRHLALDCSRAHSGGEPSGERLERIRIRVANGQSVTLVNVPDDWEPAIRGWEQDCELPMRGRVGPSLSAEFADLWS